MTHTLSLNPLTYSPTHYGPSAAEGKAKLNVGKWLARVVQSRQDASHFGRLCRRYQRQEVVLHVFAVRGRRGWYSGHEPLSVQLWNRQANTIDAAMRVLPTPRMPVSMSLVKFLELIGTLPPTGI